MMNGYLLTIAILVISAGRLGDMFGRKRAFLVGMAIFAAGSVVSATAASPEVLIAGRVVQGIGAAPMLTLSLALICNVFPGRAEQASALGIWAAVSAVALAIGPLAGGALIELDWRAIFWVNLPIAALGDRDHGASRRPSRPTRRRHEDRLGRAGAAQRRPLRGRPGAGRERRLGGRPGARRRPRRGAARWSPSPSSSAAPASRWSSSRCSATAPTSAPPPPPSPWSAPTGR